MNKPIYPGMLIIDIIKTLTYEFWYDYIKPKYQDKVKLRYMDTDSFIIHIKTEDFYKDIANDVEKWFDTSNYNEIDKRPLPISKNKKVISLFKKELGGKILIAFVGLRAKTYTYLMVDDSNQVIEYNNRNIFPKNHAEYEARKLVPDPFLFFRKALYEVKPNGHLVSITFDSPQLGKQLKQNI